MGQLAGDRRTTGAAALLLGAGCVAACSQGAHTGVVGSSAASGTAPSTGLGTGPKTLVAELRWTEDGAIPVDTDGDGLWDAGCTGDWLEITIADPLGMPDWELGMVQLGPAGWAGEDCLGGTGAVAVCHPIQAPADRLDEVCTPAEIAPGQTTLFDAGRAPEITYLLTDPASGWCAVLGAEVVYYAALGCAIY